jgi:hypothetical protein
MVAELNGLAMALTHAAEAAQTVQQAMAISENR